MPPANSVDRQAHAARIVLLAQDCADLPAEHLRAAAEEWRRTKPFLPRACELRDETLWRVRAAMKDRMIAGPCSELRAKPPVPPLSDEEIARMPANIVEMGITLGEFTRERADRARAHLSSAGA
jgi:hypothetical protein